MELDFTAGIFFFFLISRAWYIAGTVCVLIHAWVSFRTSMWSQWDSTCSILSQGFLTFNKTQFS